MPLGRPGRPSGGNGRGSFNLPDTLRELEDGRPLIRFTKRGPQPKVYRIRQDTRQLLLTKPGVERGDKVIVDLCEVREIRYGQNSKDFMKWPQELKDHRADLSFILLYGNEFVLKTFSVVAPNPEEFKKWSRSLEYLVKDAHDASYPTVLSRWLRKEFYSLENKAHLMSSRDVKNWFTKLGLKPGSKFREVYQEVEPSQGDINFDQLNRLYQKIVFQSNVFEEYFASYMNGQILTLDSFQMFLNDEQKEPFAGDLNKVKDHLTSFLDRPGPPQLSPTQFLDYLYSKHNCVSPLPTSTPTHNMTRPLSHYWISSSHNTYLTGDQFRSDSSCEAYIRVLRQGCKCIELDCWDGDREPIIYHGRTLTSKILFRDVLEAIRDHAWDVSDFPLILSIENHCSVQQQAMMANYFKTIFGNMLLREPVKGATDHLPSPNDLRRKIIIKHKKLKAGDDEFVSFNDEVATDDMSQAKLTGLLYLQDPVDLIWKPHYFVLTMGKLLFTDETELNTGENDDADEEDEPLTAQRWFHSDVSREKCLQLLETYGPKLGDGAFLVRPSQAGKGYSLSFWRGGKVNHCKITTTLENGVTKYWLIDVAKCDNLNDLITYYQSHSLHCRDFEQVLGKPITSQGSFDKSEWYHEKKTREQAFDMLATIPYDGAFLIRKREEEGSYAISFRAEGKVKHCRFNQDADGLFAVGNALFESLEELVDYYRKTPLYRKMKLRYPTNQNLIARIGGEIDESIYSGYYYIDPTDFTSDVYAEALYDYKARSDTELSFKKDQVISNINKVYEDSWWRGDLGEKKQCWFPATYVRELEAPPEDESSLGSLQKGEVLLKGCNVVTVKKTDERFPNRFRVTTSEGRSVEVACSTPEEAKDWADAVRESINQLTARQMKTSKRNEMAKKMRLSLDLSDLVVYCQTVDFNPQKAGPPYEMSSLAETKAEKWAGRKWSQTLNKYNQRQFSRVYPKGKRIDSSNYNPTPMWTSGCQMVALNFQTPDLPMHLNNGRFLSNGGCGYVLKPDFMTKKDFDPMKQSSADSVEPLSISLTVLGARHLPRRGRDIPSSFVEIEIHGCAYDSKFNKYTTGIKNANGLNPVWRESAVFDIINPDMAVIHFSILDSDVFGDPNFLGQASYPVKSLRHGYRSVPLKNGHSEEIPLAAILIHIELGNPQEDYQDVYTTIQTLQEQEDGLQYRLEELQLAGHTTEADNLKRKLASMKSHLDAKKAERNDRIKKKKKLVSKQKSR